MTNPMGWFCCYGGQHALFLETKAVPRVMCIKQNKTRKLRNADCRIRLYDGVSLQTTSRNVFRHHDDVGLFHTNVILIAFFFLEETHPFFHQYNFSACPCCFVLLLDHITQSTTIDRGRVDATKKQKEKFFVLPKKKFFFLVRSNDLP